MCPLIWRIYSIWLIVLAELDYKGVKYAEFQSVMCALGYRGFRVPICFRVSRFHCFQGILDLKFCGFEDFDAEFLGFSVFRFLKKSIKVSNIKFRRFRVMRFLFIHALRDQGIIVLRFQQIIVLRIVGIRLSSYLDFLFSMFQSIGV
jgi:hypothetical protein